MSKKKIAARKGVAKKQRACLKAACARMVELKNCGDQASASTATCRRKLLQLQKISAMALEKVMASLVHYFVMTKEYDADTTKYERLRTSGEQRVSLPSNIGPYRGGGR